MAVIRSILGRRGIKGLVFLDDILLSSKSKRRLRRAVRTCMRRLTEADFIVGEKSEPTLHTKSLSSVRR